MLELSSLFISKILRHSSHPTIRELCDTFVVQASGIEANDETARLRAKLCRRDRVSVVPNPRSEPWYHKLRQLCCHFATSDCELRMHVWLRGSYPKCFSGQGQNRISHASWSMD